ncbi:MAG: cation transporter [Alphaproteobacteria bacterium]|nr:cation transporter [Alphaproteobacteria bacterium]
MIPALPTLLTALLATAHAEPPVYFGVRVPDMTCNGCAARAEAALEKVGGVTAIEVAHRHDALCVTTDGTVPRDALAEPLRTLGLHPIDIAQVRSCAVSAPRPSPGLWQDTAGLDARIVSTGEAVDLDAIRVAGHYTIVDVGAEWCGPCHEAEHFLKRTLAVRPDVAVRAVVLPGRTVADSMGAPAAALVERGGGLPWLMVFAPDGTRLYAGSDLLQALTALAPKEAP